MPRGPKQALAVALLLALGCTTRAEAPPSPRYSRAPGPRAANLDELLFVALPRLVIAANSAPPLSAAVIEATGTELLALEEGCPDNDLWLHLRAFGPALIAARVLPPELRPLGGDALASVAKRSNHYLAAKGLPYVLEATALDRDEQAVSLVLSFAIREVRHFEGALERIDVLVVERGDGLNWSYELLGFTDEADKHAIVLYDAIEAEFCGDLTPILLEERTTAVDELWRAALSLELEELGGSKALVALLRSRNEKWEHLRQQVRAKSLYELGPPQKLTTDDEIRALASQVLSPTEASELWQSEAELSRAPALITFLDRQISRTALHEAQHRVDFSRGLKAAQAVVKRLGATSSLVDDTNAEMSAYIAEIAHSPATSRTSIARLVAIASMDELAGQPESVAARTILELLAAELAVEVAEPTADSWLSVLKERAAEELSESARRVWQAQYGRPLGTLRPD